MITFGNYHYIIYIILAALIVLGLFIYYCYWKRKVIASLLQKGAVSENLIKGSERRRQIKEILVAISIVLFAFVLLRPQLGDKAREVKSEGTDVLIALDVSPSMLARDTGVTRLDRAKNAIRWIAESLKGDRIGLILFSGDAFLQCPLTRDIGAFMMFIDSSGSQSIQLKGTDIGKALGEAHRVFNKKRMTSRMLVFITDGEDHEGSVDGAIKAFKEAGVAVYAVGIGDSGGGLIPVPTNESGEELYLRDSGGDLIRTVQNRPLLKRLASETGGRYIDITDNLSGMTHILGAISEQQKNMYDSRIVNERQEHFQIFALLLLILLSIEVMLPERIVTGQEGPVVRLIKAFFSIAQRYISKPFVFIYSKVRKNKLPEEVAVND